jgi:hypothetical protein
MQKKLDEKFVNDKKGNIDIIFGSDLLTMNVKRGSVVVYTVTSGEKNISPELSYLWGIFAQTGEIADFGGGAKMNENALEVAYREFHEETKEIFIKEITLEHMKSCVCVYNHSTSAVVVFVPVLGEWCDTAQQLFGSAYFKSPAHNEMSGVQWTTHQEFQDLIHGTSEKYRIWDKTKEFFLSVFDGTEIERILVARWWWYKDSSPQNF